MRTVSEGTERSLVTGHRGLICPGLDDRWIHLRLGTGCVRVRRLRQQRSAGGPYCRMGLQTGGHAVIGRASCPKLALLPFPLPIPRGYNAVFFGAERDMAPHSVGPGQLVRRVLVRWMAGSTPSAEESWATVAAGRAPCWFAIRVPSVWRRRAVMRPKVRQPRSNSPETALRFRSCLPFRSCGTVGHQQRTTVTGQYSE